MAEVKQADLGILGGGQLARMLLVAATALGLDVAVMEGSPDSPAGRLTEHEIVGAWDDEVALQRLAHAARTVLLENEFVPARSLYLLEGYGATVVPGSAALATAQDKLHQKTRLDAAGLPLPAFRPIENAADVHAAARELGWPLLLKRRRNGYDGYGNRTLHGPDDVAAALAALQGPPPPSATEDPSARLLMVEGYVRFARELAVMVVRERIGGTVRVYPVVETVQRNHICHHVYAPAAIPQDTAREAQQIALAVVEALELRGVAGVELFLDPDGAILVNEVAPRVHNSGHYTIEACVTSQFENAVRAALGWPLGDTSLVAPAAAMVNLLGASETPHRPVGLDEALAVDGAHVHLYGKRRSRPGRKMGHVTALGATREEAIAIATRAAGHVMV